MNDESTTQTTAISPAGATHARPTEHDAWRSVLESVGSGSGASVPLYSDYDLVLPHVGSGSLLLDCRIEQHAQEGVVPNAAAHPEQTLARSVVEQMRELRAALSLNKSQLAQILRVSRPTIYEWFQGKEPNVSNTYRLRLLLHALARAGVSSENPLNARFVRQPLDLEAPSLLDLLSEEKIDEARITRIIEQVRALGDAASRTRKAREERLRDLGFEDLDGEQRKQQLARNVALLDWPKR
jgi:transcriptional regulator with XRE-family HTH domain